MNVRRSGPFKFSMKFLLDNNVLLVEYPGREAQLFMPILQGNGITMQNIIFDDQAGTLNRFRPMPSADKVKKATSKISMSVNSHGGSIKINNSDTKSSPKGGKSNNVLIDKESFQWVRNGILNQKRKVGGKSVTKSGSSAPLKTFKTVKDSIKFWMLEEKPVVKKCTPTYEAVRRSYRKSRKTSSRTSLKSSKSRKT